MTPEDAVSEYRRVIAEYDARYGEDPLEKRRQQREADQQERHQQEVRKIEQQSANAANAAAWEEWFRHRLITEIGRTDEDGGWFIDMMGETLAIERKAMRKEMREKYETKIDALQNRIRQIEEQSSLENKFYQLEHRLDARQLARDEAKRGLEVIPRSELPAKIEALQRQVDELEGVADVDARLRELTERVGALEQTSTLEARFAQLAHEVKRGSQMIPQGELLAKFEGLLRRVDELKSVADLDARFHDLAERVGELENTNSLEARFAELAHEIKRGSEMIPQSDLLAKIEKLHRQADELERVADLDPRFRELAERVGVLEQTNSLEACFSQLAHEVKPTSEISSGELLEKIEAMQRQLDDPKPIFDLDVRFRELAERVGEIEKAESLEARFAELAHEVKRGSEMIPQAELLAKIEALQRQVDKLERVADLDARFLELTDRVGEFEKMNGLEARFTKLADEVKNRIPQSELLARIDRLERQLDDLKRIPGQSGPQGPPGKDGKLPIIKVFQKDAVYYTGDVVICDGSTYQALRDTGQNINHADWVCLARAGRNGSDGRSPNAAGAYDAREKYERRDIVALDGAAFIARCDSPKLCPGPDWQLLSRQGRPGRPGETGERGVRGEKGERGEPGATVVSWQLDRQRYRVSPLMSDGRVGPALELRALFEQYYAEAGQ